MAYSAAIPSWMQQLDHWPANCTGALMSGVFHGPALVDQLYGEDLPDNSGLTAFAYCWRRFGPPWMGSDDHKDLVQYILGTPHPEVFLTLRLSASALRLAAGYLMTQALTRAWLEPDKTWEHQFEAWWVDTKATEDDRRLLEQHTEKDAAAPSPALRALSKRLWEARTDTATVAEARQVLGPSPMRHHTECPWVTEAITAALEELRRPVWIRDVPITILGRLRDEDVLAGEDAPVSVYAGYGMPKEALDALVTEEAKAAQ